MSDILIYGKLKNHTSNGILAETDQIKDNEQGKFQSQINKELIKVTGESANHISNKSNPHNVTKAQVGLENVDNTSDLDKPISTTTQNALDLKVDKTTTINNQVLSNNVLLTKTDIGLENVDNTSDLNKPISTATQEALDKLSKDAATKEELKSKQDKLVSGNNIKTINGNSLLGSENITLSEFPEAPSDNKIYGRKNKTWESCVGQKVENGGEVFNDYTNNKATGLNSHAEGYGTIASGKGSHAEGGLYSNRLQKWINGGEASGDSSHAEGVGTISSNQASHAEGSTTIASGLFSHSEGQTTTASGSNSHAEGYKTTANGTNSHSEGHYTTASGSNSHAEGYKTTANGTCSHTEGRSTTADGSNSHAEGEDTIASSVHSHAEGYRTTAYGNESHAEGFGYQNIYLEGPANATEYKVNTGMFSKEITPEILHRFKAPAFISYYDTKKYPNFKANIVSSRIGDDGHLYIKLDKTMDADQDILDVDGHCNKFVTSLTAGQASHTEGIANTTIGEASHSEGANNVSVGYCSHSEGEFTYSIGTFSHTEGIHSVTEGTLSHAEGYFTIADNYAQHSQGQYNTKEPEPSPTIYDSTKTIFSVGNGSSDTERSDAFRLLGNGNLYLPGIGGFTGKESNNSVKTVQDSIAELSTNTTDINKHIEDIELITSTSLNELKSNIEDSGKVTAAALNDLNQSKQDTLISGKNIATINGQDITKGGDIKITEGGGGGSTPGKDGTTFIPSIDEKGNLSWTNNGGLPNPKTINLVNKEVSINSGTKPTEDTNKIWVDTSEDSYTFEVINDTPLDRSHVKQELGNSTIDVISQKIITDKFKEIEDKITKSTNDINTLLDDINGEII